jgi:hypothetical protein
MVFLSFLSSLLSFPRKWESRRILGSLDPYFHRDDRGDDGDDRGEAGDDRGERGNDGRENGRKLK